MRGFFMLTWVLPRDCWQDRPVIFHRTLWDLVFNNPDERVWRGVFSKVGVSMSGRSLWAKLLPSLPVLWATPRTFMFWNFMWGVCSCKTPPTIFDKGYIN
jgi:hypothetical protein